jgi:hypothetical protein
MATDAGMICITCIFYRKNLILRMRLCIVYGVDLVLSSRYRLLSNMVLWSYQSIWTKLSFVFLLLIFYLLGIISSRVVNCSVVVHSLHVCTNMHGTVQNLIR